MLLSLVISLLFTTINLDLTISEKNFIDPRDKSFDQSINSFSFPDNVNQVLGGLFGSETKGGDEKIQQGEFPWALANTSVWLSASSYCPYSTFLNRTYAGYAEELLTPSHYRVTHLRDIIPHTPWSERYVHIDGEWYEDEFNQIHPCTGYEDPNCSDQWYITSIDDHMLYLNQSMTCDAVTFGY
eukprot:gene11878-12958_t